VLGLIMSDGSMNDDGPHGARAGDALFTDLYQLTMLRSYLREGMTGEAVFSLFVRDLGARNVLVAGGLEQALSFLEDVHFSDEALDYLADQDGFDAEFIDALPSFSFTGDVYAVPEGTPVFAEEPLVEVVAPLPEAQLVETFLLNQITFQTSVATKARRVKDAAGPQRTVADFSARRTHGTDAAIAGARAMYVGGVDATSNVRAGRRYGLPITGTMAHSYVEAHDDERDAFRNFSAAFPETTLLVDTYDTLEGVRKVIRLAEERGAEPEQPFAVGALRLDSGDLGALATEARTMLDEAGLGEVQLFASGGLDEFRIRELLNGGAPLDGFGVGTSLGTVADQPGLDSAYKLCAYDGTPRMKLSSQKSNLPGRKQVYRVSEDGTAARDVIATAEEDGPPGGRPLLQQVMAGGERTEAGRPAPVGEIRAHAAEAVGALPERLRALDPVETPYPVALSEAMATRLDEVRSRLEKQMGTEAGGG
jgi:nicotinate phosphoribosyltransferase